MWYLKTIDNGIEIKDWFPILPKDVKTNIPRGIDIRVIYLFIS